jgi:hypothetical protein
MLTPYQFASNTPIWAIDLDGLEAYYAPSGQFLKWGAVKGDKAPVVLVTNNTVNGQVQESQETLMTGNKKLTHFQFEQVAAYAYNETNKGHDLDKYRVANTLGNMGETPGYNSGKGLQGSLDGARGKNDSHDERMKGAGLNGTKTATEEYANYFNTSLKDRNSNSEMKTANGAALNAFSAEGTDYTEYEVKDQCGDVVESGKALQWRGGDRKGSDNKFAKKYPTPGNVIDPKSFKNKEIKK